MRRSATLAGFAVFVVLAGSSEAARADGVPGVDHDEQQWSTVSPACTITSACAATAVAVAFAAEITCADAEVESIEVRLRDLTVPPYPPRYIPPNPDYPTSLPSVAHGEAGIDVGAA